MRTRPLARSLLALFWALVCFAKLSFLSKVRAERCTSRLSGSSLDQFALRLEVACLSVLSSSTPKSLAVPNAVTLTGSLTMMREPRKWEL